MPKGWFQGLHGIGHQLLQNHLLDDLLIASETRSRIAKASLLGGCGASHDQWPFCGTPLSGLVGGPRNLSRVMAVALTGPPR